jgi:site-specific DNA-methyltransferase (adenine-specific)
MTTPPTKVHISKIVVKKDRARKKFEGILELSESIQQHGLIHPIVVTPEDGTDKLILVAGERRFRAFCLTDETHIPITFRDELTEVQQKEIELEENIRRKDLDFTEEIENLRQIDELKRSLNVDWKITDTATISGLSTGEVSRRINLANLFKERPDLKKKVEHLPMAVARREVEKQLEREKMERIVEKHGVKSSDIYLGNATELIIDVPDDSVSLLLTDPPFGIGDIDDREGVGGQKTQSYLATLSTHDNADVRVIEKTFKSLFPHIFRVLKPSSHFYIFFAPQHYELLVRELRNVGLEYQPQPIVWDKSRPTVPFRGYEYMSCYETILYGWKPPKSRRLADPAKTILQYQTVSTQNRIHPFEKPEDLLAFLIKQSTNVGETVLDPFAGSGSTLHTAKSLNRQAIGFELNENHYKTALKRLGGQGE